MLIAENVKRLGGIMVVKTLQIVLDDSLYDDFVAFKDKMRVIEGVDRLSWAKLVELLCKTEKR